MQRLGGAGDALIDLASAASAAPGRRRCSRARHMRIERIVLEDHGDVALARPEPVDDLIVDD
jgi:hypothetical protein